MKKKITAMLVALLLVLALCVPAAAESGSGITCVYDMAGLLTEAECQRLENRAVEISRRNSCGVYIVTLPDYQEFGSGSIYDVTTEIYNDPESGFGIGAGREGIILLLSMAQREYALFVHGENAEYAFDSYGQAQLEDYFLPAFGSDSWYEGFEGYLIGCSEYLVLARNGDPVRESPVKGVITVVAISCLIALLVCMILKSKMNTVHRKVEAHEYVAAGGLRLTGSYDNYTHTTEERRIIEKKSESHSGGGGSGRSGSF